MREQINARLTRWRGVSGLTMPRNCPGSRTFALIRRVRHETGLELAPTQLERMRHAGAALKPSERVRGVHSGLEEPLPADEVACAAAARRALQHGWSVDETVVVMAARGYPLEPERVDAVFKRLAERQIARVQTVTRRASSARGGRREAVRRIVDDLASRGLDSYPA